MRKLIKTMLCGIFFIILGALISGSAFAIMGFDLSSLYMTGHASNRYDIENSFKNITIKGSTENIRFDHSEDGSIYVVCTERENETHNVRVEGSTLTITENTGWHLGLNFFFEKLDITVYLPEKEYEDLIISNDTGNVTIPEGFLFENIDIKGDTGSIRLSSSATGSIRLDTDTGNITLKDLGCTDLISSGDTGNVSLDNVIVSGNCTITRSTGNVSFNGSDAASLNITTDTGNITGSLLSPKQFSAKASVGKVNIPDSAGSGECILNTDLGKIDISIK